MKPYNPMKINLLTILFNLHNHIRLITIRETTFFIDYMILQKKLLCQLFQLAPSNLLGYYLKFIGRWLH